MNIDISGRTKKILKNSVLIAFTLWIFLISINLMGSAFKLFGSDFAESLISLTSHPLVGLFIGILATSIIQSSSTTTSIIVGLTASGSLTITGAVPMIMGANIGTSITNTLVSLGHIRKKDEFKKAFEVATVHDFFNIFAVIILLPLEIFFGLLEKSALFLTNIFVGTSMHVKLFGPLDYMIKPVTGALKELLFNNSILILALSVIMLFLSLNYLVKILKPLAQTEFKHLLHKHIFNSNIKSFGAGFILTAIAQSSSVTTSLIVPLAGTGIVSLEHIFPYILGSNIGTTLTAMLASLATGSSAAITVAIVHLLFNCIASLMIYPFRKIPMIISINLAGLAYRSRIYPIAYIVSSFYVLPSLVIFIFH